MTGQLGAGVLDEIFVGDFFIALGGSVRAVAAQQLAVYEGILAWLAQRDIFGVALELRPGQAGEQVYGGVDIDPRVDQTLAQRFELGVGREMGETADGHGDRVGVASGDGDAQVARQFLHAQGAQYHVPVADSQRDNAADAQEIGRDQHIDVQDVAVQDLAVEDQLAQQLDLLAQLHAQRIF